MEDLRRASGRRPLGLPHGFPVEFNATEPTRTVLGGVENSLFRARVRAVSMGGAEWLDNPFFIAPRGTRTRNHYPSFADSFGRALADDTIARWTNWLSGHHDRTSGRINRIVQSRRPDLWEKFDYYVNHFHSFTQPTNPQYVVHDSIASGYGIPVLLAQTAYHQANNHQLQEIFPTELGFVCYAMGDSEFWRACEEFSATANGITGSLADFYVPERPTHVGYRLRQALSLNENAPVMDVTFDGGRLHCEIDGAVKHGLAAAMAAANRSGNPIESTSGCPVRKAFKSGGTSGITIGCLIANDALRQVADYYPQLFTGGPVRSNASFTDRTSGRANGSITF